jgi:RNA polymerase sigma-70 factor (ECF subfamily)
MPPESSFDELIQRVGMGDDQAATHLVREFEPVVRRVLRARLRDARSRREFDSVDICQSVLATFFLRVTMGQFDLRERDDLIKLLLVMARNKFSEKMRYHQRQLRDSRRTISGIEELPLATSDPSPSSVIAKKDLLTEVNQRMSNEERRLAELRGQGRSWEEIAVAMGGTAGARRNQLARALDRIATGLGLEQT